MADYLRCPFCYYMHNVLGYEPFYQKRAINIGTLFSKAVERLHTTGDLAESMLLVDQSYNEVVNFANQPDQVEEANNDVCTVQAMIYGYEKKFIEKQGHRVVVPIIKKIIPEYKIEWVYECLGIKYMYINSLDGKIISNFDKPWILEIKTSSGVRADLVKELPTNFQINSYWGAMINQEKTNPEGVLYRFAEKPKIRIKQKETVEQFRKRIIGEYEINSDKYFHEETLYFNYDFAERFKVDLNEAFKDLSMSYVANRWPRRGTGCKTMFGHCNMLTYCARPIEENLRAYYRIRRDIDGTDSRRKSN